MFKEYSFREILENLKNSFDYELLIILIDKIKKVINEDVIIKYYPKNLFNNNSIEYFLFADSKIIICNAKYDDNGNVIFNFKSMSKMQIISTELIDNDYDEVLLRICFSTGEEIIFDNKKDTNGHHARSFKYLIEEIFKELNL